MAKGNFHRALEITLRFEGGLADHPEDPGGRTMMGVTQRVYDAYRDRQRRERRDVAEIERYELEAIYRLNYWNACGAEGLPAGLDVCVFDYAVHSGPHKAVKDLQRELDVDVDGIAGNVTMSKAHKYAALNEEAIIGALIDRRLQFLRKLSGWRHFGLGWQRRIDALEPIALKIARDDPTYNVPDFEPFPAKATAEKPSPVPNRIAAAGIGIGGTGTVLSDTAEKLLPMAHASEIVNLVCVALLIGGVGLTVWHASKVRDSDAVAAG